MNYGPPPPPPPPPFATGAPPVVLPSEIAAAAAAANRAPPPVCPAINLPPMALCGAMMKDKKPFTYTPGGLNLSEIKSPRMQRRLQRNASLEGVPVSPLAQPPRSTPPGCGSPAISHRGMIQVLPMPGMPLAVHQQHKEVKEPPKPKRNSCGPAPPPPPFAISSGSSNEPCETPNTTPTTTPAINSSFSPSSTPGTGSSPSIAPVFIAPTINHQLQGKPAIFNDSPSPPTNLQPKRATEIGPSPSLAGPPPPPPPPGGVSSQKIPLSQDGVPLYIPALAKHLSNVNPTSSSLAVHPKVSQSSSTSDTAPDSTSEMTESSSPMSHEDHQSPSLKRESSSREYETSFSESEIERLIGDESSSGTSKPSQNILKNIEQEVQKTKQILEEDTKLFEPQQIVTNKETNTANERHFGQSQFLETSKSKSSVQNSVETSQNKFIPVENKTPDKVHIQNVAEIHEKELNFAPQQVNLVPQIQKQVVPNKEIMNNIIQCPVDRLDHSVRLIQPVTKSNSPVILKPELQIMKEVTPISNPQPLFMKPEPSVAKPMPTIIRPVARMASPPVVAANTLSIVTNNKMVSPSVVGPKSVPITNSDRLMRQVSMPAQTPPSTPENKNEESTPTTPQSANAPSGLVMGPMPWMCAARKETSHVPEFLKQARKTQNRLQRQRSLPRQELKSCTNESQVTHTVSSNSQNGVPYSPPIDQVKVNSPIKVYPDGATQQIGHNWSPQQQQNSTQMQQHTKSQLQQQQSNQYSSQNQMPPGVQQYTMPQHQQQSLTQFQQQPVVSNQQHPMSQHQPQQYPMSQPQQYPVTQHKQHTMVPPQQRSMPELQEHPMSQAQQHSMSQLQQQQSISQPNQQMMHQPLQYQIPQQQQRSLTQQQQQQQQQHNMTQQQNIITQQQQQNILQPQYQPISQQQYQSISEPQYQQISLSQQQALSQPQQQHAMHQPQPHIPQSQQHQMGQSNQQRMLQSQQQLPRQQQQLPQSQQHSVPQPQQFQVPQPQQYSLPQQQKTPSSPQSRFMQQQMNSKIAPQQNSRPRERIIPIMLEEASPDVPNTQSTPFQQPPQGQQLQQPTWAQSNGGAFSPPSTSEVVFNPFDNQIQSSSTAIEALQQMQQNLAQLNSGLQTAQHQPTTGQEIHPDASTNHMAQQSKGFRVIQNAYDHQANNEPLQEPILVEPKKYTGGSIPSRSFRMLQAMTDTEDGPGPGESDL